VNNGIEELEKEILTGGNEIKKSVEKLLGFNLEINEVATELEKILKKIPELRKKKEILKLEKSVSRYSEKLQESGVSRGLIDFIVGKRREKIQSKDFNLTLWQIYEIEKKLKIFDKSGPEIFSLSSSLLKTDDIDEIEVITRKMRANIDVESSLKKEIVKQETILKFVEEGGFEEKKAVCELLNQKTLSDAIKKNIITEDVLNKKLKKLEGEMTEFQKEVIKLLTAREKKLKETLAGRPPFLAGFFSDYLVNPISWTFGVLGTLIIILYALEKFLINFFSQNVPAIYEFLYSTGITALCARIKTSSALLTGFIFILVAGLARKLDQYLKKIY